MQGWLSSQQTGNWQADSHDEGGSTRELAESRTSSDGLEGHIATTDLLNPSDALDLLAQIIDLYTVCGKPSVDQLPVIILRWMTGS